MTAELTGILGGMPAVFFRALGLFALLPFEAGGSGIISRCQLALLMAVLFRGQAPGVGWYFLPLEFLTGLLLSLPAALFVSAGGMLGEFFDIGRGQNVVELYDPLHEGVQSLCGQAFRSLFWVLLLSTGLLPGLLAGFSQSLAVMKPAGLLSGDSQAAGGQIIRLMVVGMNRVLSALLPLAAAFFMVDAAACFLGKALPQINLQSETFLARSLLGILVIVAFFESGAAEFLMGAADPQSLWFMKRAG